MNRRFWIILGSIALAGSGPALSQGPIPGGPPAKRYPWDQRQPKCFLPDALPAGPCRANDWPDYGETKRHVDQLLMVGDPDLLDRAENELGYSDKRFPSGDYYFDAWFYSMDMMLKYQSQPLYKVVDGWGKAKGEGGYVKLAETLLRFGEGQQAGRGFSNTVTREATDIYWRKMREANQILDSASDRLKHTGPWYVVKLRLVSQLPELKKSRDGLLAEAAKVWPEYTRLYIAAMEYSLPAYGGSYEEVEKIARFAVESTKAKWGTSWYAIVYNQMARFVCQCTLTDAKFDWDLMKQSFRDYEARGRGSESVFRAYANMACVVRDRKEARRLLEAADKMSSDRSPDPPDPCREFAFSTT